ncbi:MAG: Y-family DNA polymerase [Pseudomonadota bacterium]
MKRVAALYLPEWPLDRLRQAGPIATPPDPAPLDAAALEAAAAAERRPGCSVPREAQFRPGARWARTAPGDEPAHRRPKRHEIGRRSEAADPAYRRDRRNPVPSALPAPSGGGLVTALRTGNRIDVAAADAAARALGIAPGMALTTARAIAPGLDIRPADPDGDADALRRLTIRAARRWSPVVAIAQDDTLLLDLTGVAHLFGGEEAMARRIVRLLARLGFAARIAIADTAGAAWALAHGGHDRVFLCPPGGHGAALARLPIDLLRIEPRAVELLRRLGVDRIGTLATMPRAPLVRRFGAGLVTRLDQALGLAPEPLDPVIPPEAIAVGQRFVEPIATAEGIALWFARLVPPLVQALAQAGLGARLVELVAERVDGDAQRIRVGMARASRDPVHLIRLLGRRIESIEPGFGIDALSLHVRRAERLSPMPMIERLDEDAAPDLAPLVDTLATRIGSARLWRHCPRESDVPERSVAPAPVLDPPGRDAPALRGDDVRRLDRHAPLPPWHARWPRPARLLRRPERIDNVLALLPDQPPRRFTWRGTTHQVVCADGPERVHGEWWRRAEETHSVRDYFRVEDEQGRRYWLFRRGDGERPVTGDLSWYLHGVFG